MANTLTRQGSKAATIRWGTSEAKTGALASYIVKSIKRATAATVEKLPDEDGFTVGTFTLVDGDTLDITCFDDTAVTPPVPGTKGSVKAPGWGGVARDVLITSHSQSASQKAAGELSITAEYLANMTLA